MRIVIAQELVGLKKLGCDLYDENGKVVYHKETDFTPEIFMMLSHSRIFKRDEEPIESKDAPKKAVRKRWHDDEPEEIPKKKKSKSFDGDQVENKELNQLPDMPQRRKKFDLPDDDKKKKSPKFQDKNNMPQSAENKDDSDIPEAKQKKYYLNDLYTSDKLNNPSLYNEPDDPNNPNYLNNSGIDMSGLSKEARNYYLNELYKAELKKNAHQLGHQHGANNPHLVNLPYNFSSPEQAKIFEQIENLKQKLVLSEYTQQTNEHVKITEPFNSADKAEYKSVINDENKKQLISRVKEVLYCAINTKKISVKPCIEVTNTIMNEMYSNISNINKIDELRIQDYYTFTHSVNVAMLSAVLGKEMGYNEYEVKDLTFSAFLHDVGKMRIPRKLLYKPSIFTPDEMNYVKGHTILGYEFLVKILGLPDVLARPSLEHHERWEGSGYPFGISGNKISEYSQIIAIADVYDALVSEKVYRGAVSSIDAIHIMSTEESKSFNPEIFNKFIYIAQNKANIRI